MAHFVIHCCFFFEWLCSAALSTLWLLLMSELLSVLCDSVLTVMHVCHQLGDLKIALRGGVTWTPAEGGGGGLEKWFRVGPFVLCKNGCWRQRRRNTKFWPEKVFSTNNNPPPPFE